LCLCGFNILFEDWLFVPIYDEVWELSAERFGYIATPTDGLVRGEHLRETLRWNIIALYGLIIRA